MADRANRVGRRLRVALAVLAVIPAPRQVVETTGTFRVTPQTPVIVAGGAEAEPVARQFAERLKRVPGIGLRISHSSRAAPGAIRFRLEPAQAIAPEGYRLVVEPSSIELTAADVAGLRNGAVTLWQLAAGSGMRDGASIPAAIIDDAPRFRWRGLMLDSARHYQSPEFVERYIDWMALHKLNVLHWHLTDDQGWRLQIRRYPRLTEVGAWRVPAGRAAQGDIDPATRQPRREGGYYSQRTVRRIVRYAAERGVTIVPEIEMPGHASAAIAAYPELGVGTTPLDAVPSDWGVYPNLYNAEDSSFAFLENVLREVIALFPGPYVHVGGDEAVKDQWHASPQVQARMRDLGIQDETALQNYFVQRMERFLSANGRRLIGWDEILEGAPSADVAVMSWRGLDGARAAARAGHDVVIAAWPTLYFDNRQGRASSEPPGRGRVVSLRDVYGFDTRVSGVPPEQSGYIIGIQANVWTEHVRTEERVEWMTWPRAAAVAELGWSPEERLDFDDFRGRLSVATGWYRQLGLRYATTEFAVPEAMAADARSSQQLETCTDKIVLNLEDDAPLRGARARFMVDIMNPCWLWRGADLTRGARLEAAVGQFPFNFQIGRDREAIHLRPPATPSGELEVRVDRCDGEVVASLPLAPAVGNDAVTRLPAAAIGPRPGRHDLCFTFTGERLDPMWALDRVELHDATGGVDGERDGR